MGKIKFTASSSQNSKYDRFYIVNYKEFGKNWETATTAADEISDEDVPNGFNQEGADDDNDQDKTWDDWNGDRSGAVCLFCEAIYTECNDLLIHMTSIHDFDFQVTCIFFVSRQTFQQLSPSSCSTSGTR